METGLGRPSQPTCGARHRGYGGKGGSEEGGRKEGVGGRGEENKTCHLSEGPQRSRARLDAT